MGFVLIDHVIEIEPGKRGSGRLAGLPGLPELPACLAAEAVGQLAAWVAMAAASFQRRPVAGIAGCVTAGEEPPGSSGLDLEAVVESMAHDAIAYSGSARVEGRPFVVLSECVGPMLPMEDFCDPDEARTLLEALISGPWNGGRPEFPRIELHDIELHDIEGRPGGAARARLDVPAAASFFADHFPRKPVFPATLLLDAQIRLAVPLAGVALGLRTPARVTRSRVLDAKMRSFVAPGASLELEARLERAGGREAALAVAARSDRMVSTARLELVFETPGQASPPPSPPEGGRTGPRTVTP